MEEKQLLGCSDSVHLFFNTWKKAKSIWGSQLSSRAWVEHGWFLKNFSPKQTGFLLCGKLVENPAFSWANKKSFLEKIEKSKIWIHLGFWFWCVDEVKILMWFLGRRGLQNLKLKLVFVDRFVLSAFSFHILILGAVLDGFFVSYSRFNRRWAFGQRCCFWSLVSLVFVCFGQNVSKITSLCIFLMILHKIWEKKVHFVKSFHLLFFSHLMVSVTGVFLTHGYFGECVVFLQSFLVGFVFSLLSSFFFDQKKNRKKSFSPPPPNDHKKKKKMTKNV